ncbi:2Fe-2S iron-sulfur cluster-binding protein [Thalassotalea crassostreae]|uniref:2Fe-2S iron-sulfur cluster-binding protein n=1 Tax=Thalassotalea crassostreae TaxID=1763536 RepID=UPI000837F334|nr:2Fe-2S iron-sulfur cluster-binding protein [Thalassotalea crassostreae]
MGHVTLIETCGTTHEIDIPNGQSILEGALANDIFSMPGACGGDAVCATCHCVVEEDWINKVQPVGDDEYFILQSLDDTKENSRLACQIRMKADLDGLIILVQDN